MVDVINNHEAFSDRGYSNPSAATGEHRVVSSRERPRIDSIHSHSVNTT